MTVQDLNTLIGENIRHYRKSKGWCGRTLAKKVGMSDTTVSNHENGHNMPSPESLLLYCCVLDIEVHQLYTKHCTNIVPKTTGDKIKYYREKKGLSQRELSNIMGVSPAVVSVHERGIYNPIPARIKQYADVLDIEIIQLFGEIEKRQCLIK